MDCGGTTLLGSPLANFHLDLQGRGAVRMFEFTLKIGDEAIFHGRDIRVVSIHCAIAAKGDQEAIFHGRDIRVVEGEIAPFRHHYRCCLCEYEGVLEFEPDASEPSWTECHDCGFDNEIPPGVYDRPAIIHGYIPSRNI